jgi:hypothetical protein
VHFWSFKKILAGQSGNKAKVFTVFPSSSLLKRAQLEGVAGFNLKHCHNLALALLNVPSLLDNGIKSPIVFSCVGHDLVGGLVDSDRVRI